VRFVLNAKGIPFEEIKLDLLAGRAQEVHRSFLTIPPPLLPIAPPVGREFIALIGGGGLLLTVKVKRAWGQQPVKIPRIGILDDAPMWQAFRQALRELGYVEGQNIAYEYRYGEGAPDRLATAAETKVAASTAGIFLIPIEVRAVGDFDAAFAAIIRERPDAILVSNDPFHQLHIGRIIEFLAKNRLPAMSQSKEGVAAGGFIGYGPNLPDLFRRAAGYVHRILQGAKPADLPVELPTKFDLAVNLKTAKTLGLELTPTFIARADEVIE
jgi:ABC transporter substrate binding protein